MANSIGSMLVSIEANTAKWTSDMALVERTAKQGFDNITRYGNMAASAAKGLCLAVAGISAGIGISTLGDKFESVTKSIARMKEMAERTGSSIGNLSGLSTIGQIGGRDFDAVEAAIQKMNEALQGSDDEANGDVRSPLGCSPHTKSWTKKNQSRNFRLAFMMTALKLAV